MPSQSLVLHLPILRRTQAPYPLQLQIRPVKQSLDKIRANMALLLRTQHLSKTRWPQTGEPSFCAEKCWKTTTKMVIQLLRSRLLYQRRQASLLKVPQLHPMKQGVRLKLGDGQVRVCSQQRTTRARRLQSITVQSVQPAADTTEKFGKQILRLDWR